MFPDMKESKECVSMISYSKVCQIFLMDSTASNCTKNGSRAYPAIRECSDIFAVSKVLFPSHS